MNNNDNNNPNEIMISNASQSELRNMSTVKSTIIPDDPNQFYSLNNTNSNNPNASSGVGNNASSLLGNPSSGGIVFFTPQMNKKRYGETLKEQMQEKERQRQIDRMERAKAVQNSLFNNTTSIGKGGGGGAPLYDSEGRLITKRTGKLINDIYAKDSDMLQAELGQTQNRFAAFGSKILNNNLNEIQYYDPIKPNIRSPQIIKLNNLSNNSLGAPNNNISSSSQNLPLTTIPKNNTSPSQRVELETQKVEIQPNVYKESTPTIVPALNIPNNSNMNYMPNFQEMYSPPVINPYPYNYNMMNTGGGRPNHHFASMPESYNNMRQNDNFGGMQPNLSSMSLHPLDQYLANAMPSVNNSRSPPQYNNRNGINPLSSTMNGDQVLPHQQQAISKLTELQALYKDEIEKKKAAIRFLQDNTKKRDIYYWRIHGKNNDRNNGLSGYGSYRQSTQDNIQTQQMQGLNLMNADQSFMNMDQQAKGTKTVTFKEGTANETATQTDEKIHDEELIAGVVSQKVKETLDYELRKLKDEFQNHSILYKDHIINLKAQAVIAEELRQEAINELLKLRDELDKQNYLEKIRSKELFDYLVDHRKMFTKLNQTPGIVDRNIDFEFPQRPKPYNKYIEDDYNNNKIKNDYSNYINVKLRNQSHYMPVLQSSTLGLSDPAFEKRLDAKVNDNLGNKTLSQTALKTDKQLNDMVLSQSILFDETPMKNPFLNSVKLERLNIGDTKASNNKNELGYDEIWIKNQNRLKTLETYGVQIDQNELKNLDEMLAKYNSESKSSNSGYDIKNSNPNIELEPKNILKST